MCPSFAFGEESGLVASPTQKPVTSVKAVEGMNKDGLILEGGSGQTRGTAYDTP
jgi:hypothetical protein